ncbi:hypothetical protein ACFW7J_09970 [Streptomyces sp. NPDC059525]|uniref:hypothetical protein n=1 Tax=Streptomyces sp. NPDC059525 TaxID=3346857 RepID=UPI0036AA8327
MRITPTASKYTFRTSSGSRLGASVTIRLYPYAAAVPSVMREFMSALRWRRVSQPVEWIG